MKKVQAWVNVKKNSISAHGEIINMIAPVLFKLLSAQTHNSSLPAEPTP
jgi:hypothetical protein